MYVCMYACLYVRVYVCMYACVYVLKDVCFSRGSHTLSLFIDLAPSAAAARAYKRFRTQVRAASSSSAPDCNNALAFSKHCFTFSAGTSLHGMLKICLLSPVVRRMAYRSPFLYHMMVYRCRPPSPGAGCAD